MKYIVKVTPQESEVLQQVMLKAGYRWRDAGVCVKHTDKSVLTFDPKTKIINWRSNLNPIYEYTVLTSIEAVDKFEQPQTTKTERNIMNPYRVLAVQNATETAPAEIITETTILAANCEQAKMILAQNHPNMKLDKTTIYCVDF